MNPSSEARLWAGRELGPDKTGMGRRGSRAEPVEKPSLRHEGLAWVLGSETVTN